jgi:CRISPR-associated protein Cas1
VVVAKDEEVLADRAVREVRCLVTFGGVHVTTDAMLALLGGGCDIAFMSRGGHFKGRAVSAHGKNCMLRHTQHDSFAREQVRLAFARRYVEAKIRNGCAVLTDYHYSASNPYRDRARQRLTALAQNARQAGSLESLRGIEGSAARLYFGELARCLMHGRQFPGRVYHPSTDPVNALLSFGYSFLARELQAALEAVGLDPYIGFFHDITYGRASLSLDLMEEFRHPLVDRLVLRLFNRRLLDDDDFEHRSDSPQLYLKKESLKIFVRHYEEWANSVNRTWNDEGEISWRQAFWRQAEKLRSCIEHATPYTPFAWKEEPLPPVAIDNEESDDDLPF